MLGLFGRKKPLTHFEELSLETTLSGFKQIYYILELEGSICSLDPEFSNNGLLRKSVNRMKKDYNSVIYTEECSCNFKQRAKLNMDGTPRKHTKYVKDWAR
jgi:hypothetical protein